MTTYAGLDGERARAKHSRGETGWAKEIERLREGIGVLLSLVCNYPPCIKLDTRVR